MGGDHKCPHVGRHLRAHTGDRPYECKECPLRFARSDLLSRHVNKAHAKPTGDDGKDKKEDPGKKQRRKSLPNPPPPINPHLQQPDRKSSSISMGSSSSGGHSGVMGMPNSMAFQNQRMYPHHPLLHQQNGQPQSQAWSTVAPFSSQGLKTSGSVPNFGNLPLTNSVLGSNEVYNGQSYIPNFTTPFTSTPMRMGGSADGNLAHLASSLPTFGLDFSLKKRACDQCNLSKVRCDFGNPCARCSTRATPCTYTKQQRSRSIAHSMSNTSSQSGGSQPGSTINPAVSLPMLPNSSHSPQSMFSSPNSSTTPPNMNNVQSPNFAYGVRRNSIAVLPSSNQPPLLTSDALTFGTPIQQKPVRPPVPNTQWQQPPQPGVPQTANTNPQLVMANYYQAVPQVTTTQASPMVQQNTGTSMAPNPYAGLIQSGVVIDTTTPPQGTALTPSLSSSTSPSNSDGPPERNGSQVGRESFSSVSGTASTVGWSTAPSSKKGSIDAALLPDGTFGLATAFTTSPVNASTMEGQPMSNSDPTAFIPLTQSLNNYQWPTNQSTVTSNAQMQQVPPFAISDDPDATMPSGATNGHPRRRSSAGTWATAFNQMTLQDPSNPVIAALQMTNGTELGNQMAQQLQTQMANYQPVAQPQSTAPMQSLSNDKVKSLASASSLIAGGNGTPGEALPSLGDAKDLWKLFMNEPTTGPTPSGNKQLEVDPMSLITGFQSSNANNTPRGADADYRSLAKSQSMPDLNSPNINGSPTANKAAANGSSGVTPKPMLQQNSYMPQPVPVDQNNGAAPAANVSAQMWKKEIHNRQSHFEIAPGAKMRVSAMNSVPGVGVQTNNNTPSSMVPRSGPPLQPPVQPSLAMLQTLAPERTPSFGLNQGSMDSPDPLAFSAMGKTPVKLSSAMSSVAARPGNKRLASQTLLPDLSKIKSTVPGNTPFGTWDGSIDVGKGAVQHVDLGLGATVDPAPLPIGQGGAPMYPMASASGVAPTSANDLPQAAMMGNLGYSTWPPITGPAVIPGLEDLRRPV